LFSFFLTIAEVHGLAAWILTDYFELSIVYSIASFFTTLRWFGCAYCNNNELHNRVVISDAAYTILCMSSAGILFLIFSVDLLLLIGTIAASMMIATFCLGKSYLSLQIKSLK
jgi:hypothetical protein